MNFKNFLSIFVMLLFKSTLFAQGSLQYNQALIISDQLQTVPAGKVWKIQNIYGSEFRINECVDLSQTSTHEAATIRCSNVGSTSATVTYEISAFQINGVNVLNYLSGLRSGSGHYCRFSGTTCGGSCSNSLNDASCANRNSDPNTFPMWVPAGTTVRSNGPNTYLTVIEFNILP
jgi:hypothetical protein